MIPELAARIEDVVLVDEVLAPSVDFRLALEERRGVAVDSVLLQAQIRIEATRRTYSPREQEALRDLFGEPSMWGRSVGTLLWTHASVTVPRFEGSTVVTLHVPCSADLSLAATRYLGALEDGEVPLVFQFSGTIFYLDEQGRLVVSPLPWSTEARFRLPVADWRRVAEMGTPGSRWVCLRRELVDELLRYKADHHLPTLDAAVEEILDAARQQASR